MFLIVDQIHNYTTKYEVYDIKEDFFHACLFEFP